MLTPVTIFGATGYTGQELFKVLARHPRVSVSAVTSESSQGRRMSEVTPLRSSLALESTPSALERVSKGSVAFLCLPHGEAAPIAEILLERGARIIDLSADFRQEALQSQGPAHYGLNEVENPAGIPSHEHTLNSSARLIANPGCYPTSVLLPLIPLLRRDLISSENLIIDSKSGASGAGRSPKTHLLLAESSEDFSAYSPGRTHRHVAEIDASLKRYTQRNTQVIFTPHLLPIKRGILSTIYCRLSEPRLQKVDILEAWKAAYSQSPCVWIFDDALPHLAHVVDTNRIAFGCVLTESTLIIVSVLDNLLKGAAGQAVQNMNVMLGHPHTLGLEELL